MNNPIHPPTHDHATLTFPKGFLWGSATSALQVEGNNIYSDWWEWAKKHWPKEKQIGDACNEYALFEKDFDLLETLHQNAHRLGLEWSRIEPEEGVFNDAEIEHYKKVLGALKKRGIKVMLTLHHFSNPLWLTQKGGWENFKSPFYFERFVKKIVPELGNDVDLWITINEPGIYVWHHYLEPIWPYAKKGWLGQIKTYFNFARAHKRAFKVIHKLAPGKPVGIAHNVQTYDACHKSSVREQAGVMVSDLIANRLFYFLTKGYHDFLGINYYFHHRLEEKGGILPEVVDITGFTKDVSDMGWEIYPEGIFEALINIADGLPVYITECGIATTNDDRRIRFLMQYLQQVYRAIEAGVNVKGFFYWSLLDNFELANGYDPKFGLVEVNSKTQKRTVKPSALIYADIAKTNGIRHELMKFLGHRIHATEVIKIPGVGKV